MEFTLNDQIQDCRAMKWTTGGNEPFAPSFFSSPPLGGCSPMCHVLLLVSATLTELGIDVLSSPIE